MLDGISFGQYFPAPSVLHRLDARIKILLTILMVVILFIPSGFAGMGAVALFIVIIYALSRIPFRLALRSVRAILPVIIIMTALNVLYLKGDTVLWEWWTFTVSVEGIIKAAFMALRIILLIVVTSLLTYTTTPIDLTDGLERLLRPLNKIRVPVHDLAMIMTIALRFIPTLMEEAEKIMSAQKARGADIDTGGFLKRIKALIPILVPLLVSAVRRAVDLATAMDCRCYRGGEGRTQMRQMKFAPRDGIAVAVCLLLLAAVIAANMFVPV